jgi:hypothetical protein
MIADILCLGAARAPAPSGLGASRRHAEPGRALGDESGDPAQRLEAEAQRNDGECGGEVPPNPD